MEEFIQSHFNASALLKVGITIAVCLFSMFILKLVLNKYFAKKLTHQSSVIFSRIISVTTYTIMGIVITSQLGFSSLFTAFLGTAGIAGVAIGFASKTSLENIISGVLLMSDKSIKIDDIIKVDGVEGIIESIDSLSIKVRTFDNKIVRIPNVKFLNSNVENLYPNKERRKDFYFKVSYDTNLSKLEGILKEIASKNSHVIRKQDTYVYISSFENIGYKIKYGVWFIKGNAVIVTNSVTKDIAHYFETEGIEIPTFALTPED